MNGALLCADLLPGKGFLGGVDICVAGLDDQQLCAGLIEVAEVDLLCTLRGVGEGCDAQVNLTGLNSGDDAVEGHVHYLQLNAQAVGNLLCQPHIAANEVSVQVLELIGGILGLGAHNQLAAVLDLFEQGSGLFLLGVAASAAGLIVGLAAAGHNRQQHQHAKCQCKHLLCQVKIFHTFLRFMHLNAYSYVLCA